MKDSVLDILIHLFENFLDAGVNEIVCTVPCPQATATEAASTNGVANATKNRFIAVSPVT